MATSGCGASVCAMAVAASAVLAIALACGAPQGAPPRGVPGGDVAGGTLGGLGDSDGGGAPGGASDAGVDPGSDAGASGGTSGADGGSGGDLDVGAPDGGPGTQPVYAQRRPSPWRVARAPIMGDRADWFVPPAATRARYPADRIHSPATPSVTDALRNVVLHGPSLDRDAFFMKIGDSITAGSYFLRCLDGDLENAAPSWEYNVRLDGRMALAETVRHYRSGDLGGLTPFSRESLAARVGMTADFPLAGAPPVPLDAEIAAVHPEVAVVMYGTNDMSAGGSPDAAMEVKLVPYEKNLAALVDAILARGIVPILSTVPPRAGYERVVSSFNAVVRAIAQARQVPLVDFNLALQPLAPTFGLGSDGIHPTVADWNGGCWFDAAGLAYGYDVRNLVTLEALDRVMRVIVDGATSLDAAAPSRVGAGTSAWPFAVTGLPFSDADDTRLALSSVTSYTGCPDAPGPEYLYELTVSRATAIRAALLDRGTGKLRLHLVDGASGACLASAAHILERTLGAGTYHFAVESVGATAADGAEFTFIVVECVAGDLSCATH